MPITSSAKKAHKQSLKRRVYNLRHISAVRSVSKQIARLVKTGSMQEAQAKLREAQKAIDKAAKHGVIKANAAARKISRLAALVVRAKGKK